MIVSWNALLDKVFGIVCISSIGKEQKIIIIKLTYTFLPFWFLFHKKKSAHGITVIIIGNGLSDTSSNPKRDCIFLEKGINPTVLLTAMDK